MTFDANQRIAELEETLRQRDAVIAKLLARIDDLEARLNQNSRNSNTPPSANPPGASTPAPKKPTGRKPGGQPGHPGSYRAIVVPKNSLDHFSPTCGQCDSALKPTITGNPIRHQVTDLPAVCVEVIEHRLHRLICPGCGHRTRASLPAGVPTS